MAVGGKGAAVGLKDDKGIHRHTVAGGEDLRVVDAEVATVKFATHRGEQVRAIRAPDKNLRTAAGGLRAQQDHRFIQIVAQQVAGVPGELRRRMSHEIVGAAAVPDLMQRLFINIVHPQQGQRLQLMVTHSFAHVRGALHAATQLLLGGEIEFTQQALLPAVPQGFVGGADIGDGQTHQIAQTIFRLHLLGELLNHLRILNIAPLGGDRHQQVVTHQPGDQLRFARVQPVQLGKLQHILRAEDRVVAAAPFGDVVEQGGN